jgi:hypothetical protein
MKSQVFTLFGIRDADSRITPERDADGVPRLVFTSKGNPLVKLDMARAAQLRQMLIQAGSINEAYHVDNKMVAARQSPLRPPVVRTIEQD